MSNSLSQGHVHELIGSVKTAEQDDPHGHRFSTVTGEVIPISANDHVHEVVFSTDFYDDHYHEFRGRTGGAVQINNKHVHYIQSTTSINDSHSHDFEAATMINNPTGGNRARETSVYEDEYPYDIIYRNDDTDLYAEDYLQYWQDNHHRH